MIFAVDANTIAKRVQASYTSKNLDIIQDKINTAAMLGLMKTDIYQEDIALPNTKTEKERLKRLDDLMAVIQDYGFTVQIGVKQEINGNQAFDKHYLSISWEKV